VATTVSISWKFFRITYFWLALHSFLLLTSLGESYSFWSKYGSNKQMFQAKTLSESQVLEEEERGPNRPETGKHVPKRKTTHTDWPARWRCDSTVVCNRRTGSPGRNRDEGGQVENAGLVKSGHSGGWAGLDPPQGGCDADEGADEHRPLDHLRRARAVHAPLPPPQHHPPRPPPTPPKSHLSEAGIEAGARKPSW
jgi:hypothetical protein